MAGARKKPAAEQAQALPQEKSPRAKFRERRDQELFDYLEQMAGDLPDMQVGVYRDQPAEWEGVPTRGMVGTFYEPVSEEEIKSRYGGGKYTLKIKAPNGAGKYVYQGNIPLEIAGPPLVQHTDDKIEKRLADQEERLRRDLAERSRPREDPIARRALDVAEERALAAEERAERLEEDAREMKARVEEERRGAVEPMVMMVKDLISAQRDADERLARVMAGRDGDAAGAVREIASAMRESHDRILAAVAERGSGGAAEVLLQQFVQGESARMQSLVTQTSRELDSLRERHRDEVARIEDRHARTLETVTSGHARQVDDMRSGREREIDNLRAAHEREIAAMRSAHQSQVDTLKLLLEQSRDTLTTGKNAEIRALEREIERLTKVCEEQATSLDKVRAQKDETPVDQMRRLAETRAMFQELFGGQEGGQDPGVLGKIQQLASAVLDSPIAEGVARRLMAPPGFAVANDGVHVPVQVAPAASPAAVANPAPRPRPRPVPQSPAPTEGEDREAVPDIPPGVLEFLETAVLNDNPPGRVVVAARTVLDGETIAALVARDPEELLRAARVPPGSPLATDKGRAWFAEVLAELRRS